MLRAFTIICLIAVGQTASGADGSWVQISGSRTSVVPFEMRYENKAVVQIGINGGMHGVFLDTGADTLLDIAFAKRLGLRMVETEDTAVGFSGALGKRWTTTVDIQLGEIIIKNYPVNCIDLSDFFASVTRTGRQDLALEGVIGDDLLELLEAQIDFRKHRLTVHVPKPKEQNGRTRH